MKLKDDTKLKKVIDIQKHDLVGNYPSEYKELEPGIRFFGHMTFGYFKDIEDLIEIIEEKVKFSIADTVLIGCLFAKTLLEETKVEHAKLQYTFLISNKKNNDILKKNKGNSKKPEYILSIQSKNEDNSSNKLVVLSAEDIIKKDDNLYRTIGLLKGHHTLLNKKNRIIGILPDNTVTNIRLHNILNLRIASFEADDELRSSMTILTKITKELEGTCGLVVSTDSILVIFKGNEIMRYNKHTARWKKTIEKQTWNFLKNLIGTCFGEEIKEKIGEKIKEVVKKISESEYEGAIIVLGTISNEENDYDEFVLENYSSQSHMDLQEFSGKKLEDMDKEDLFDICIMDGATLIDVKTQKVRSRVTLRPKFAFNNNANTGDVNSNEKFKDFDIFEIPDKVLEWTERGRRFSFGTRHQNGLGMAFCTYSLTIIISSTGEVTIFYPNYVDDNGTKYKVQGYSLLEFGSDLPSCITEPNWPSG